MQTHPLSNNINSWQPVKCSASTHTLITFIVASILASLALVCYFYGWGEKIAPALLAEASAFSIAISIMLIPYRTSEEVHYTIAIADHTTTASEVIRESPFDEASLFEGTPPITPPFQPSPPKPNFGISTLSYAGLLVNPKPRYAMTKETIIKIYEQIKTFEELNRATKGIIRLSKDLKLALLIEICQEKNQEKQKISSQILDVILPELPSEYLNAQCEEMLDTPLHLALVHNVEAAKKLILCDTVNMTLANNRKQTPLQLAASTLDVDLITIILQKMPEARPLLTEVVNSQGFSEKKAKVLQLLVTPPSHAKQKV